MQPQQIPQPQVVPQNAQIPVANQPIPNQFYQVIQTEAPNSCEKCSNCLTGTKNLPLTVFTILMSSLFIVIFWSMIGVPFWTAFFIPSSIFNFLFALFVWCRMAAKIERNTSTVKYGYLYLVNLMILSLVTLTFPLFRIWNFVLFETILIAFNNRDKKIKFFCCRISGTKVIVLSILYHLLFNSISIISLVITIAYAFIYNKWLSQKLNISNEKVQRMEGWCIIQGLKNKFQTFITLEEVLNKDKKEQPLVQDVNNSVNMSFIPANMYPNYYSGIIPGPNQQEIQMQQLAPAQAEIKPPVVYINQIN